MDHSKHNYLIIQDLKTASDTLGKLKSKGLDFAFDLETSSLHPAKGEILGIGFSFKPYTGFYVPLRDRSRELFVGPLKPIFSSKAESDFLVSLADLFVNSEGVKIAHNLDFELEWMIHHWGIEPTNTWDTMAYRSVCNSRKSKEKGYLKLETIIKEKYPDLKGLKDIWGEISSGDLSQSCPVEKIGAYCCGDADATFRYYQENQMDIVARPFRQLFARRLMPAVHFVNRIKRKGFRIDVDYLRRTRESLLLDKKIVLDDIQSDVGSLRFNPASTKDLQDLFFNKLKAPPLKDHHLDEDVLETYSREHGLKIADKILEYRSLCKLIGTYFDGIESQIDPTTGRIHANLNLWFARTGRLSCSNPNLQNLPSRQGPIVKRMFIPDDGYDLIGADYSQIELRLIAFGSQDPVLLKAYTEGLDVHALTAAEIFGVFSIDQVSKAQRRIGKSAGFAWQYLGGPGAIFRTGIGNAIMGEEYAKELGMSYVEMLGSSVPFEILYQRAKQLHKKYFQTYAGVVAHSQEVLKAAKRDGFVSSYYGRVLHLPDIKHWDEEKRKHAERQAFNFRPQSTASDYLLFHFNDMVAKFDELGLGVDPLLMVHDQAVMQSPKENTDKVVELIPELGTALDEANITIPMVLEPEVGQNLGEV